MLLDHANTNVWMDQIQHFEHAESKQCTDDVKE